jgi:hypothetical protein
MSITCNDGVDIPTLISEPCNGEYISTACITSPVSIIALNLPINATQQQINNALVLVVQNLLQQIVELTTRIEVLETL